MRKCVALALLSLFVAACQNISCPLDNVVMLSVGTYADGESVRVGDTLTVTMAGTDSVLLNRLCNFNSFQVPLRQQASGTLTDTLFLHWSLSVPAGEEAEERVDTLFVEHACRIHFESIDCPSTVFHDVKTAGCSHQMLDSVSISNPLVDYEHYENLRLHFSVVPE